VTRSEGSSGDCETKEGPGGSFHPPISASIGPGNETLRKRSRCRCEGSFHRSNIGFQRARYRDHLPKKPSTISRDLEAMGIVRREGVYRPPIPQGDEAAIGKMEEFIRRVRSAGPYMLVFDTSPGMAKAVAVALKSAAWPEVRGVLAEDDTLFVATDNVYDSRLLLQRLKRTVGT
jgi:arginine repressor